MVCLVSNEDPDLARIVLRRRVGSKANAGAGGFCQRMPIPSVAQVLLIKIAARREVLSRAFLGAGVERISH